MQTLSLSPELCGKIVDFTTPRRPDLLALIQTCKAFQREAEPRLYAQIMLSDTHRARSVCRTLHTSERGLALHVRAFCFTQDRPRPTRRPMAVAYNPDEIPSNNLGREFWGVVQSALTKMGNLEILLLADLSAANSWVLDDARITFRLRELKIRFAWDIYLVRFLRRHGANLKALHCYDCMDLDADVDLALGLGVTNADPNLSLPPNSLPDLRIFDGMLSHALHLLALPPLSASSSSPPSAQPAPNLSHIQLSVDLNQPDALATLTSIVRLTSSFPSPPSPSNPTHKHTLTLRALSLLDPPHDLPLPFLALLAPISSPSSSPSPSPLSSPLRHLGLLPYPISASSRPTFLAHLLRLPYLTHIELDLSRWAAAGPGWGPAPSGGYPSLPSLPSLPSYPSLPSHPLSSNPLSSHPTHASQYPAYTHQLTPPPPSQRALASEIRTFCPSIRVVVFWIGNVKVRWAWVSSAQLGVDGREGHGQEGHGQEGYGQEERHGRNEKEGGGGGGGGYGDGHGPGAWVSRVEQGAYPQYSNAWSLA
ncbi:hypothetical protein GALMADRAFT_224830 [Galerina marginata CBS 339.88]|uniref:Uncharacterized protein n=1 Tax=Galerina marginata (strain CBS 339.88) TaxID=685588 RepID=A0A067TEV9_GALM3|nr:hypothetical protein GALMADRAFT_224830 [Galerina marginata CBS 339.88]